MMNRYIAKIRIERLFHLSGFEIPFPDDAFPNLIITGRNGTGKTVLLNALADYLDKAKVGVADTEGEVPGGIYFFCVFYVGSDCYLA